MLVTVAGVVDCVVVLLKEKSNPLEADPNAVEDDTPKRVVLLIDAAGVLDAGALNPNDALDELDCTLLVVNPPSDPALLI